MSKKLKLPTKKEFKSLRGMEFIYEFTDENGIELDGKSTTAYVAQADRDIGITIKGLLPVKGYDEDVVIQCCNSCGDPYSEDYIEYVNLYFAAIKSGVFTTKKVYSDLYVDDSSGSGNAEHMEVFCPF